ncbi:MAG TPA: 5'-nucleotidase, partial [Luteimonas sp.]
MPDVAHQLPDPLIVAISSRALFDLEDSHALFEREGIAAYQAYQREREDQVLAPGIAFQLVRKLLALNAIPAPAGAERRPRVEVILLSRNSSDTGLRIFNSIEHHGLDIRRATFTSGAPTWPYVKPFGADLFLSANPESVRRALENGIAAATILPTAARPGPGAGPGRRPRGLAGHGGGGGVGGAGAPGARAPG